MMAHTIYDNFYLSNEIEDQFKSHLALQQFCKTDNSLAGTAGMVRKINKYSATSATEKLAMGAGNTQAIEVSYTDSEYRIQLAQNCFKYYDEQEMTDPMLVPVGVKHMGTDMFNTENADIFAEFKKTPLLVLSGKYDFNAFVDAVACLNVESGDNDPAQVAPTTFAFVNTAMAAEIRKNLKDDLRYVEAFSRNGYVGTVAGVNLYAKKDADTLLVATRDAVTLFNKKGTEVEQRRDPDKRENIIYSRKYYIAALTDETKAVAVRNGTAAASTDTSASASKTYYAKTNNGYVKVTPATGDNPATKEWYEITFAG